MTFPRTRETLTPCIAVVGSATVVSIVIGLASAPNRGQLALVAFATMFIATIVAIIGIRREGGAWSWW